MALFCATFFANMNILQIFSENFCTATDGGNLLMAV